MKDILHLAETPKNDDDILDARILPKEEVLANIDEFIHSLDLIKVEDQFFIFNH